MSVATDQQPDTGHEPGHEPGHPARGNGQVNREQSPMERPSLRRHEPRVSYAQRGRLGAHIAHSRNDPRAMTATARGAFLSSFERQADPDGILPVAERMRRAEHLKRAHFLRMALKSAATRKARGGRRAQSTSTSFPSGTAPDATTRRDCGDVR